MRKELEDTLINSMKLAMTEVIELIASKPSPPIFIREEFRKQTNEPQPEIKREIGEIKKDVGRYLSIRETY